MGEHACVEEVRRQHVVIADWLGGRDRGGWDSFEAALGAEFEIVAPDGQVVRRADLLDGFHVAFGSTPGLVIEIKNATVLNATDASATVRYEEWQSAPNLSNRRISTALFTPDSDAPLSWAWRALHETWLASVVDGS